MYTVIAVYEYEEIKNWKIFIGVHGKFQILKGRETFANYNFFSLLWHYISFHTLPATFATDQLYLMTGEVARCTILSQELIICDDKNPLIFFRKDTS